MCTSTRITARSRQQSAISTQFFYETRMPQSGRGIHIAAIDPERCPLNFVEQCVSHRWLSEECHSFGCHPAEREQALSPQGEGSALLPSSLERKMVERTSSNWVSGVTPCDLQAT